MPFLSKRLLTLPALPDLRARVGDLWLVAVEVLIVALAAWQLLRLVWIIATPATSIENGQPVPPAAAHVDTAIMGQFDPFFRRASDESAAVSSLGLVLAGTRVDRVSGRGAAIIATPDGLQSSYAVGDTILPGVVLNGVGFDNITIARGGGLEKLFIDQSAGSAPVTPESAGLPATNPGPRLADDLLVTPRRQGNSLSGFTLTPKGTGAAFAAAGFQPGDVLLSVNGVSVASLKDSVRLQQQLGQGSLAVTVERAGKPVSLRIDGR